MATWRQMERLVDMGLVRHIGTSNMTIPKLRLVLRDARIKPAVNEMELHPHFQQPELFEFVRSNGVEPVGYSPIGSPVFDIATICRNGGNAEYVWLINQRSAMGS